MWTISCLNCPQDCILAPSLYLAVPATGTAQKNTSELWRATAGIYTTTPHPDLTWHSDWGGGFLSPLSQSPGSQVDPFRAQSSQFQLGRAPGLRALGSALPGSQSPRAGLSLARPPSRSRLPAEEILPQQPRARLTWPAAVASNESLKVMEETSMDTAMAPRRARPTIPLPGRRLSARGSESSPSKRHSQGFA
jgi:hypothetical protein